MRKQTLLESSLLVEEEIESIRRTMFTRDSKIVWFTEFELICCLYQNI